MAYSQEMGKKAEDQACHFLRQHGLQLITRNYRCRVGEIDLIMQDKEVLCFIEVRFRQQHGFGSGAESVTRSKQNKLIKAAYYYLQQEKLLEKVACRFDVVAVTSQASATPVEWIKNAFSVN